MADDVDAYLRAQIARVQGLADAPAEIAAEAAKLLRAELDRSIAAGQSPAGERWQPTQAGDAPLTGAGDAVTITAPGPMVFYRIGGPEALHHLGRAKGKIVRQVIPNKVTPRMAELVKQAADRVLAKRLGG
jgi:hypothetical protein